MAVGRDLRLRKREHVLALPPSWGTLYVLPKLDDEQWKTGIAGRSHRSPLSRASAPRPDQSGAERDDVAGDEAHRDHRAPFGQAEIGRANPQGLGCGVGVLLDAIALSVKLVVGGLPVIVGLLPLCFKAVAFRPTLGTLPLMDQADGGRPDAPSRFQRAAVEDRMLDDAPLGRTDSADDARQHTPERRSWAVRHKHCGYETAVNIDAWPDDDPGRRSALACGVAVAAVSALLRYEIGSRGGTSCQVDRDASDY